MTPQRSEHQCESEIGEFRAALCARIGRDRYQLWFERFDSPRIDVNRLLVTAGDSYSLSSVNRLFEKTLRDLARESGLAIEGIEYRVESAPAISPDVSEADRAQANGSGSDSSSSTAAAMPGGKAFRSNAELQPRESSVAAMATRLMVANSSGAGSAESGRELAANRGCELSDVVTGSHNQMAVLAAMQVAQQPGCCTPLYIYGPSGSGKTWLLRAIARAVQEQRRYRSLSISAEQFVTGYIEALQGSGMPSFRAKHRDVDLLLLDDVHFVAGKRATIGELTNTIDRLCDTGRQLIVTSNRPPSELTELGQDLASRLGAGLVCPLEHPEGEAKRRLIARLAALKGLELPDSLLSMMADELSGDARQLLGAVHRLVGLKLAGLELPGVDEARRQFEDLLPIHATCVGMSEIEEAVCETFGINRELLRSSSKTRQCSQPRMLAMWLARRMTRAALSEIGDYFGGRRHSTVATAQRTVDSWLKSDRMVGTVHRSLKVSDAVRRIERRLSCG